MLNIAGILTRLNKKYGFVSEAVKIGRKSFNKLGLDLVRYIGPKEDLSIYHKTYNEFILKQKPFYNIGAGSFYHPYWTNIDLATSWYRPIQKIPFIDFNLMHLLPLPLPDNTAKIMYTSHTIEHVTDEAVQNLFNEVYRCLEQGGIFRITCPDSELNLLALLRSDEHWFDWDYFYNQPGTYENIFYMPPAEMPLEERWISMQASQLAPNSKAPGKTKFSSAEIKEILSQKSFTEIFDYFASFCNFEETWPENHISWWTHSKIIKFLENANFKTIYRSGYGQSNSPLMRNTDLFDNTYPKMSCYIEAKK